jgi:hypothetical protein
MKNLIFLFFCLFFIIKNGMAQDTTVVSFYGENLNGVYNKENEHFPLLITHTKYGSSLCVRIFGLNTQEVCKIQSSNSELNYWTKSPFRLPDADFRYLRMDSTSVYYDAKKRNLHD